jgi:hypothetical protein
MKIKEVVSPYWRGKKSTETIKADTLFVPGVEKFAFITPEGSTATLSIVVNNEKVPVHTCTADEGRLHSMKNMPANAHYICDADITLIRD